jgi:hypothetical protein
MNFVGWRMWVGTDASPCRKVLRQGEGSWSVTANGGRVYPYANGHHVGIFHKTHTLVCHPRPAPTKPAMQDRLPFLRPAFRFLSYGRFHFHAISRESPMSKGNIAGATVGDKLSKLLTVTAVGEPSCSS